MSGRRHVGPHGIWLAAILGLAFGLRLAAVLWLRDTTPYSDYFYYHEAGRLTAQDWGFWFDAASVGRLAKLSWWPPGYAMFLGAVYEICGPNPRAAALVQVGLGTLACFFVYAIGRRAADARLGLLAAFLIAVDPTYIVTTNLTASENLFVVWFGLGLWLALRPWRGARGPLLAGAALAAATLVRAVGLLLPVVIGLWKRPASEARSGPATATRTLRPGAAGAGKPSAGTASRGPSAAWWRQSAVFFGSFLLCLAPWSVRNAVVVGSPALVAHGGGLNFYFGQNDSTPGYREVSRTPMAGLGTAGEIDRRGWELGLQHLVHHPLGFFARGAQKVAALFGSAGYAMQANNAVRLPEGWEEDPERAQQAEAIRSRQRVRAHVLRGVLTQAADAHSWLLLVGGVAACLFWQRLPAGLRLMAWIALAWVGAHVLFWAQPRFRYPLEIPLALLASFALLGAFSALRARLGAAVGTQAAG